MHVVYSRWNQIPLNTLCFMLRVAWLYVDRALYPHIYVSTQQCLLLISWSSLFKNILSAPSTLWMLPISAWHHEKSWMSLWHFVTAVKKEAFTAFTQVNWKSCILKITPSQLGWVRVISATLMYCWAIYKIYLFSHSSSALLYAGAVTWQLRKWAQSYNFKQTLKPGVY